MIEIWMGVIIGVLVFFLLYYRKKLKKIESQLDELTFAKRSQQVKHGKNWEHFVPFMKNFAKACEKDNFVFIGMPIDGICFDDDHIKFVEIKTGKSSLNSKQRKVRAQIKEGKVKWVELKY